MRARFAMRDRASVGWPAMCASVVCVALPCVSRRAHDTETALDRRGSIDLAPRTVCRRCDGPAIVARKRCSYHSRSSTFSHLDHAGVEPGLLAQVAPLD